MEIFTGNKDEKFAIEEIRTGIGKPYKTAQSLS